MSQNPQKRASLNDIFVNFADNVSTFIGTPLNIALWILIVLVWIGLFGFHILNQDTNVLPGWFTSNAFNFPLNTVTTLAELYIGFLCAAATSRAERRMREMHVRMMALIKKEETMIENEEKEIALLAKPKNKRASKRSS